jgi:hypothetical protein
LPVDLAVRYQINMALGSIKNMANVERFHEMVLPLLWTEIVSTPSQSSTFFQTLFLQRLYSLPDMLAARFRLYLNVLPLAEQGIMYFFLGVGGVFLAVSLYKFVTSKSNRDAYNTRWIEDDFVLNIERKLSNYRPERKGSMNSKELEVYFSSLVTPLNQEICAHDDSEDV